MTANIGMKTLFNSQRAKRQWWDFLNKWDIYYNWWAKQIHFAQHIISNVMFCKSNGKRKHIFKPTQISLNNSGYLSD